PLPGSLALPLSSERGLQEVTHWQGRRIDPTGLVSIGERELDLGTGTWISADPLGHLASWSLTNFANNDPSWNRLRVDCNQSILDAENLQRAP
ncbi:MAG: hypothetical protein C5B47_01245, partial [Verrucomicrobia bacterium]